MLYITEVDIGNKTLGVRKKIIAQIDAFNKAGLACKPCYCGSHLGRKNNFKEKIRSRIPFCSNYFENALVHDKEECERIYIRKPILDNKFILSLKGIRSRNPDAKIVMELPTYPYDNELKTMVNYPLLLKERVNRLRLRGLVDRIAVFTDDTEVFGIPTLHIQNGIDFHSNKARQITAKNDDGKDAVQMIAVAQFAWWHGFERMLEGLHAYYSHGGTRRIVFHLVGNGPEEAKYRRLIDKYHLEEHAILHGSMFGEELDALYDSCSLGISSLGLYRQEMYCGSPLKTREYMAKGMPFVSDAAIIDIAAEDIPGLYLKVPSDDSPIRIEDVLEFYDRIYQEPEEQVVRRIRSYAEEHVSMEAAMQEVIDYFKGDA